MNITMANVCIVCREARRKDEPWFLLLENHLEDKLKILRWNDRVSQHGAIRAACCAAHVREAVIHWMTTTGLDHPFARNVPDARPPRQRSRWFRLRTNSVDAYDAYQIGELAVHRESIKRIFEEHPQSIKPVLDSLLLALEHEPGSVVNRTAQPAHLHVESSRGA
jgi:hypothetical protein